MNIYVWSRGAMETRLPPKQKIVGSTPTGIVLMTFYTHKHIYRDIHTYILIYTYLYRDMSLLPFVLFPEFFSLPCKQGWPSGPRRQFKVLFSSEAWVRTPLLAFFLFPFSMLSIITSLYICVTL